MALTKDKEKVLDEVLDDKRIQSFLNIIPPEGINADFNSIEKAYRCMNERDFTKFVTFFVEAGKNINAQNVNGKAFIDIVSEHAEADEYVAILKTHGA